MADKGAISGNIRADNADKLKRDFVAAKKGAASGKRPYEEVVKQAVEGPPAPKKAKVTKGDVARTQHLNAVDKANAVKVNKSLQSKMAAIRRYETSKLIGPLLRAHGDKSLLCMKVSNERDADLILDHIRDLCGNQSPQDKLHGAIVACAAFIEHKSDGEVMGQPIHGLTDAFYHSKADLEQELEEFRCEYGNLFSAPWYMRLIVKGAQISKAVVDRNKEFSKHLHTKEAEE